MHDFSKNTPQLVYTVPVEYSGARLSTVLRQALGCSGTLLKQVKYDGLWCNGSRAVLSDTVTTGDNLTLTLPEDPPSAILPVTMPLDIPYEDEHLLVVNKAAGVTVHPGPDHHGDTLGNYVTAHYIDRGEHHLYRPVNRLDKGTSGLMVVAKHSYAQERLRQQLHSSTFQRTYLALCQGIPTPPQGTVSAPIGRLDGSVIARTVRGDGAAAITHYETLSVHDGCALVRLTLETGRTHQIRVHMAHMGCPLVGDFLYGEEVSELGRPLLHSAQLGFVHPVTGEGMEFEAACPFSTFQS